MLVFGENDSRRLSNFLQTHIFWKFDHIFKTYNQINYRNIWFAKVSMILIMMAQVLFFDIFFEKNPHLNAVKEKFSSELILVSEPRDQCQRYSGTFISSVLALKKLQNIFPEIHYFADSSGRSSDITSNSVKLPK